MKPLTKSSRQAKTKLSIVILAGFLLCSLQSCGQENKTNPEKKPNPDYSNVDYSKRSNIIKNPAKLTGDEKAIFYHPYFLKLTSEEAIKLKPLKIKEEFAKLGITTNEKDRFQTAYSFFKADIIFHKKSCQNLAYFEFLKPKPKN